MEMQKIRISEITPSAYNPRVDLKPGDPDYEKLKTSIVTFGLVDPLVLNRRTGNLVGGHQRLKVLIELAVRLFQDSGFSFGFAGGPNDPSPDEPTYPTPDALVPYGWWGWHRRS